ncbi:MAG: ATP-binding cassette domain-containing protein [Thermoplasmata archaeon]|nr:ATP-binding cassette domain-containing protein [Thermoplasmata archaeon]MCI4359162.1 ATP-binding cassette domain-containing protein [Thermoplasmata archaeon]
MATPSPPASAQEKILEVRNLRTYFFTYDGVVKALDGVTFHIRRGETLGLVGETGCGKSVTAFSITRLIADPPGRIMDGSVRFDGANLLWGVQDEARFKPVRKTNRVKVTRRYRRIRQALDRMTAIRGGGISMIFQEPMSALNPIFSISDQIGEALVLHRGGEIIERLLNARSRGPEVEGAVDAALKVSRSSPPEAMRSAADAIGRATRLPSLGTQAYYILRGTRADQAKRPLLEKALRRARLSGFQRSYLKSERRLIENLQAHKEVYLEEMRHERLARKQRRALSSRRLALKLQGGYFGLPFVKRAARRPLTEELFWQSVGHLEGVSIANPVQVARGYPHELSGGMIQRVMIAMALSAEPELLIADEPTTALDVTIQAQILDLMRDLKSRAGTAILLITHDLGVIAEVADRVCVMYAGNVVEVAPVRTLFQRPLHPYTQGLLASIPRLDDPGKKLESIPGSVPNLIYPPSGCRFHPRCPQAMLICKETRPPMTIEGEGHRVACFLYHGPEPEPGDL